MPDATTNHLLRLFWTMTRPEQIPEWQSTTSLPVAPPVPKRVMPFAFEGLARRKRFGPNSTVMSTPVRDDLGVLT